MGTWIKRIGVVALLVAIIGGLAFAMRETPILIDTEAVAKAPMSVSIREEGVTRVRDIYTVSSPISGFLGRTSLHTGDHVEAGIDVIAAIRPADPPLIDARTRAELIAARDAARAAVDMATIEINRADAAARLASDNLERADQLAASGIISDRSLDEARSNSEVLAAQVAAARAALAMRQSELSSVEARLGETDQASGPDSCCVEVRAPISGTVLAIYVESEQTVVAGTRLADLGDTGDLEVSVDLLSSDAVRIAPGTEAIISDWGGDTPLAGSVRRVEPAAFTKVSALGVEEQRVNAVIDLEETDPRLGHGFRVLVELVTWRSSDSLQVPISALFRDGRNWNVFVVEADRARQVAIDIGHMNEEAAEVISGLEAGQTVIVHPADTLVDGSLVAPRS